MNWFKFYGQEYLSDPKIMGLGPVERALWLTILCLASSSNGVIEHIDEYKIMVLTGIMPTDDEWVEAPGFLQVFEKLGMITIDNNMITVKNYQTRQSSNLSSYERVKRHREKIKSEAKNDNKRNVINDNAREDKNRIDKNKEIYKEKSISYLTSIPEEHLTSFTDKFVCTKSQVKSKGEELYNYCKAKGKTYKDYQAFLSNALRRDYGLRTTTSSISAVDYVKQKEEELAKDTYSFKLTKEQMDTIAKRF